MKTGRRFLCRSPVARHHRLNQGRRSWTLGLQQFRFNQADNDPVLDLIQGVTFATRNQSFVDALTPFGGMYGWNLNGSAKSVQLPVSLTVTQKLSLACWFRVDTSRDYWVFNKGTNDGVAATTSFDIGRFGGGNLRFAISDGATLQTCNAGSTFFDAIWHRVVGTYDGTNARVYVDGVLLDTQPSAATIPATAGNFWDWGVSGATAIGVCDFIADMSVWDRALTTQEVRLDYTLSRRGYRDSGGPIQWVNRSIVFDDNVPVTLTSEAIASETLLFTSPARFEATGTASATASGLGDIEPSGPAEFESESLASNVVQGGVPTLVSLSSNALASNALTAGSPAHLETVSRAYNSITSIPDGNRRILAQDTYKR